MRQILENKKGQMVSQLQVIAFGIIALVLIVGVGITVLTKFGDSQASCASDYTFNTTQQKCVNATNGDPTDPTNTAWVSLNYGRTQLGSAGLLSWLPAIIALIVGVFFLAYFMGRKGKEKVY
jgi:hypothetical protein